MGQPQRGSAFSAHCTEVPDMSTTPNWVLTMTTWRRLLHLEVTFPHSCAVLLGTGLLCTALPWEPGAGPLQPQGELVNVSNRAPCVWALGSSLNPEEAGVGQRRWDPSLPSSTPDSVVPAQSGWCLSPPCPRVGGQRCTLEPGVGTYWPHPGCRIRALRAPHALTTAEL